MDDEDCPIVVQDEDNLKQPICAPRAPDEVLVIGPTHRVRSTSLSHHLFRLVGLDAVPGQMLHVPVIPAKVHLGCASDFTESILIYIKLCGKRPGEHCFSGEELGARISGVLWTGLPHRIIRLIERGDDLGFCQPHAS
jgi:hypothetical protein